MLAKDQMSSHPLAEVWEKVKDLENAWWSNNFLSFSQQIQAEITQKKGLRPESMRLYGEIAFLLLDLKPCVMITGLGDPSFSVLESLVNRVIMGSGLLAVRTVII